MKLPHMEHHTLRTAHLSFSAEARDKENIRKFLMRQRQRSRSNTSFDVTSSLVFDADYSPLYIAMANEEVRVQSDAMQMMRCNDRRAGWEIIADGYRRCPLLVLRGLAFELNDATVTPPLLVQMVRTCQDPDLGISFRIPHTAQEWAGRWAGREIVDERDVLVVRWWLAYLQLDAKEWQLALQTLSLLLDDCDQGLWPEFYIPEVLYQTAVVHFSMGFRELCRVKLERYFAIACALDRNLADAKLLMLWATKPVGQTSERQ